MTLVELLISTTLMALLTAGALTAYAHARAAYHTSSVEQRLHERAQYAFATLELDVQTAGYFGAGAAPQAQAATTLPASAMACGVNLVSRLDRAIESSPRYLLTCPAQGRGAVDAAQMLTVRRASTQLANPSPGRGQWLNSLVQPARAIVWDGVLPNGIALDPPRTELRNLIVRSYYIARASDGDPLTPALRVKTLSAVTGNPTFIDTEVMPGVDNLQVELLPSATAPGTVRITLGVRADANDARAGEPLRRLSITRTFALRNAPRPS
jgi:Tfp pilus assembly protein PilE